MKLFQALNLLSKPKLLLKIIRLEESDTGSALVKSYKDLMNRGKPTADFADAEMLNLVLETPPEARVLQNLSAPEFLPYDFLKWEFDQYRP